MSEPARHIEDVAVAVVRQLVDDQAAMRKIAMAQLRWLTTADIEELTGYDVKTIERWRRDGYIRMFLPGDSREYRTTLPMWLEDQAILIRAGLLDERGVKPTIKERKRRIAELKRETYRVFGSTPAQTRP